MAIKGKKKSQSRGSQARKRPAAAPRPTLVSRQHVPWYRKPGGRVAVAIGIVLAISAVGGIIAIAGSDGDQGPARRRLTAYTDAVREVRAQITIPASQMASAPGSPDARGFDDLGSDSRQWSQVLAGTQPAAAALRPPSSVATTAVLFSSSVDTYASAAQMFSLASTLDGDAQVQMIGLAAAERERALNLWIQGLRALESARSEAGMDPSGLQPPASVSPVPPPAPPPANSNGGGGNDGGGAKKNSGGKKGGNNQD